MRVFISWSGDLSKRLAEVLRTWLPSVLQVVRPYYTPSDIEKGAKWDSEISKELERTDICLIALTRESLKSHWITFEAGAISRTVDKARVCPIVFDIEPTDIEGPLARFQATRFDRTEILGLLRTINLAAGDAALTEEVLRGVFDMWWPRLEKDVQGVLATAQSKSTSPPNSENPVRTDRELIEETLALVRNLEGRDFPSPIASVKQTGRSIPQHVTFRIKASTKAISAELSEQITRIFNDYGRIEWVRGDGPNIEVQILSDPGVNFAEITNVLRQIPEVTDALAYKFATRRNDS